MIINSIKNEHIKTIKKLSQKKYQKKTHQYLIEGRHLVDEALKYGTPIEVLSTTATQDNYTKIQCKFTLISNQVASFLSDTMTPEGVFAVMPIFQSSWTIGNWIIFDGLQDPGNAGTILRTADFFDYQGVFFSDNSVSPYMPKLLRAAQGSNFHLQIITGNIITFLNKLRQCQIPILGTVLHHSAQNLANYHPPKPYALILGNEGQGISKPVAEFIDHNVIIPANGQAESLNVAVAAGILMYTLKINIDN